MNSPEPKLDGPVELSNAMDMQNGKITNPAHKGRRDLIQIDVTHEDVPRAVAEAWEALREANGGLHPPRFVRVGNLPCVRMDDGLEALTPATLTYWLARTAVFFRVLKSGERTVKPPSWLVRDMLAEPHPALPEELV